MADGFVGLALAFAGTITKLALLGYELASVEADLLVIRDTLRHDYDRLEFVRTERSLKYHLLDPRILSEIDSVLQNFERACDSISVLVDEPLSQFKKKGRVRFGQRVEWMFCDSTLAKAWNDYRQTTHVSLMSVWGLLLHLQPHQTASAMQYNEHDQDLVQFAPKPQGSTIRTKSSPLYNGGIPVVELTSSEESGYAGQGYGVVNRSISAGNLETLSYKSKDHIRDNEPEIGSVLARREIAFSKRHGSGPDVEEVIT